MTPQGIFVFLFYVVFNNQIKSHWLVKLALQEKTVTTTSGSSSVAGRSTNNPGSAIGRNYPTCQGKETVPGDILAVENEGGKHTFPAKENKNADI